jgi:hypothetical protein
MLILVSRIQAGEFTETPRSSISETRFFPQVPLEASSPPDALTIDRPKSACSELFKEHHDAWYPRRLSFSIAQDAIETWYVVPRKQSNPGNIHLKP